jgi:NADH-quinone oxidoreductase subunit A
MNFLLSNIELQTNKILLIFVVLSVIISSIVLLLSLIIASQNPYYEKVSAYECGFEPFEDARNKFEVRFYIVAILFIIFDLEVVYMLP